jgi:hypothetical protein
MRSAALPSAASVRAVSDGIGSATGTARASARVEPRTAGPATAHTPVNPILVSISRRDKAAASPFPLKAVLKVVLTFQNIAGLSAVERPPSQRAIAQGGSADMLSRAFGARR